MTISIWLSVILTLVVILAFVSGKFPMSIIGAFIIFAVLLFKLEPTNMVFAGFGNDAVVILTGMFVVGAGLQKTTLIPKLAGILKKYSSHPRWLIVILGVITFLLATATSAVVTLLILMPILQGVAKEINIKSSKFLYPLAVISYVSTGSWFLGVGALNLSFSSMMTNLGAKTPLSVNDFLITRIPLVVVVIIYCATIGYNLLPNKDPKNVDDEESSQQSQTIDTELPIQKNIVGIVIFFATVILMIASSYIGMKSYIFSTAGAILMVICGILTNKEALKSINLNLVFFIAGMLALANSLQYTGAGKLIGTGVAGIASNIHNHFLLLGLFMLIPMIMALFINNIGVMTIFVPLWTTACLQMGLDPRGAVLGLIFASTARCISPVTSTTLAIVMNPGGYSIKDFVKVGLPLQLVALVVGVIFIELVYPL